MRRKLTVSFSALSGVIVLFLLLLVVAVILTNQFLVGYLQRQTPVSLPLQLVAFLFMVAFLAVLGLLVANLVRDLRRNQPGVRFKIRLLRFFVLLVLLTGVPPLVLTGNILRNAFDVWFVRDTDQALAAGSAAFAELRQNKTDSLRGVGASALLAGQWADFVRDPERAFARVHGLNADILAVQAFRDGRQLAAAGDSRLWLEAKAAADYETGPAGGAVVENGDILRFSRAAADGAGRPYRLVLAASLPTGFADADAKLGQTRQRLSDTARLPVSYQFQVFVFCVMFFVPMLLIAFMLSFYLAEEVMRPLQQLELAVNRVAQGDYSTRLIARREETMGHFIKSFNDMVGELEHSRLDLKQSERLQTWQDIAQRMAHEIKNPLTPIKLAAERLRKKYQQGADDFPAVLEDGVATIIQEVGAISALLTEFRDFARLPTPVPAPVNFLSLVQQTWSAYAGLPGHALDLSGLDPAMTVSVDQKQFMQVFRNLFQNAIDAAAGAGRISVRSFAIERLGAPMVRIQVQDEGAGIAPEHLKDIFVPYFTTKKQGSGLGLAIVEKIVLDHGGRIWAESAPGIGTSFFIDLPRPAAR